MKFSKMGEGVVFLDDDAELEAVIEEAEMEAAAEPEDSKAKAPLVRTRSLVVDPRPSVPVACLWASVARTRGAFRTRLPNDWVAVLSVRSNDILLLTRKPCFVGRSGTSSSSEGSTRRPQPHPSRQRRITQSCLGPYSPPLLLV